MSWQTAAGGWTTRLGIILMFKQKIRENANICEVHGQPLYYNE